MRRELAQLCPMALQNGQRRVSGSFSSEWWRLILTGPALIRRHFEMHPLQTARSQQLIFPADGGRDQR